MNTIEEFLMGQDAETIKWMKDWHKAITSKKTFTGWAFLTTEKRVKYHTLAVEYIRYCEDYIEQHEIIEGEHVGDY